MTLTNVFSEAIHGDAVGLEEAAAYGGLGTGLKSYLRGESDAGDEDGGENVSVLIEDIHRAFPFRGVEGPEVDEQFAAV